MWLSSKRDVPTGRATSTAGLSRRASRTFAHGSRTASGPLRFARHHPLVELDWACRRVGELAVLVVRDGCGRVETPWAAAVGERHRAPCGAASKCGFRWSPILTRGAQVQALVPRRHRSSYLGSKGCARPEGQSVPFALPGPTDCGVS